ncbi:hypothetical protein FACS1894170_12340 [Planctomycetales bacterium]|nr:hypothetical protein FACS1894170_12340 [Planctomycetales bacterium]
MKHLRPFIFLSVAFAALPLLAEEIKIDADFPGGNIKVVSIDGDNVKLAQDLRDTAGSWFYWTFRIRGAEGRTLHFSLPGVVGARGPAISHDGINWHWLSDKAGFSGDKFDYIFKQDEKEVYFSQCINYTEKHLNLFLEKYKNNPALKVESLCITKKGRNVELLRIAGNKKEPGFQIFLTSRHHCAETMATYTLEGIIETALSDTDDGHWLQDHADLFIVPLVDKDGVEDGDQGKNRKPHDYELDYKQPIYTAVQAITEQVPKWLNGKPLFFMDMHCPWLRNGDDPTNIKKGTNEYFYFVGIDPDLYGEKFWKEAQRFGTILEKERQGTIPYRERNNLKFGILWNVPSNYKYPKLYCTGWGAMLPNTVFASPLELPFANAEGIVVDADSARALGNDLARAIRAYLEALE